MEATVGIDFGTSNSALAITVHGETKVIDISTDVLEGLRQSTLKSVLFIDEEWTTFVGQSAVLQYLHERDAGRFMQSLKAFLPIASFDSVTIYGERITLEQLIGLLFQEIKKHVDGLLEGAPCRVVIGRPVVFSEDPAAEQFAEIRLQSAAEIAGFTNITFQLEPVAATLAYAAEMNSERPQVVLMGDFGGGTSDFTVMRLTPATATQSRKEEILSVGGVPVGGDAFDSRIMWEKITPIFGRNVEYRNMSDQKLPMPANLMRSLCQWHTISFMRDRKILQAIRDVRRTANDKGAVDRLENLIVQNKGILIFQAIERAKRELSSNEVTRIQYADHDIEIDEVITRTEFDSFIAEHLARIKSCVETVLSEANVEVGEIDAVLLTGGTSFIPAVRHIFEELAGEEKVINLDAFTSVAKGLATS